MTNTLNKNQTVARAAYVSNLSIHSVTDWDIKLDKEIPVVGLTVATKYGTRQEVSFYPDDSVIDQFFGFFKPLQQREKLDSAAGLAQQKIKFLLENKNKMTPDDLEKNLERLALQIDRINDCL